MYRFILPLLLIASLAKAQTIDFYSSIKNYDLNKQWRDDSIRFEGDGDKIAFPEPIGFIGDNYQRFYIHYLSVVKTGIYEYKVTGKTRVKDNICSFTGTITIIKAQLYKQGDVPGYKQGFAVCQVNFAEDSTQTSSGFIKGQLTTNFYIDKKGRLHYDALVPADGFSNNECAATWTSYKTKKAKKCNWGDFRIPDSGDLDHGVGEFTVSEEYVHAGWDSYMKAFDSDEAAMIMENKKWWK